MNPSAIAFFLFGAALLWGGLALCLSKALRKREE